MMDHRRISFRQATAEDAENISLLVILLSIELSDLTQSKRLNINIEETTSRCYEMMKSGNYFAILGFVDGVMSAVATLSESYSLNGGGQIGLIQEFYVSPVVRSDGIGSKLMEEVKQYASQKSWVCIDFSAPKVAKLNESLGFYEGTGFKVIDAYRMRHQIEIRD